MTQIKTFNNPFWCFAAVAALMSQDIYAGAFSLYTEASAVEIGNFAAGSAAEAVDASTGWYNPAGLVLLNKNQALVSGVGVFPSTKISGLSTYNTVDFEPYKQSFDHASGGEQALVPAVHVVHPLGDRAAFGVSLVAPFGLSTQWYEQSAVRYAATLTQLTTVNASPEISGLLTDHLSFGAGLDLQWARVKFDGVAGSPAGLQFLQELGAEVTPNLLDSSSTNQGSSFGVGFHAGLLSFFNHKHTRVGLNYQSRVSHEFRGYSCLKGRLADPELLNPEASYRNDDLYSDYISLPDIVTLSAYQDLSQKWAVLGSVVYTNWSTFQNIRLFNVAGYSSEESIQTPVTLTTAQNYRNAWRAAAGLNYHVTDAWMIRGGGGYDQTPTVNQERDVRLPDGNRWALSLGSHYAATPSLSFDIGYTYLFGVGQPMINKTQVIDELSSVTINAHALNHAQLGGIQAIWNFDAVKS